MSSLEEATQRIIEYCRETLDTGIKPSMKVYGYEIKDDLTSIKSPDGRHIQIQYQGGRPNTVVECLRIINDVAWGDMRAKWIREC